MHAVWLTGHGGPSSFVVRETPDPQPKPKQVRIRVRAAGVNFAELMASLGLYPDAPKPPTILGYEGAGTVDAVGDGVDNGLIGRRVIALSKFGMFSELACVNDSQIFDMPASMSFEEGAALPVNYLTAYHMLFHIATVRPGESVLVHMAAGGVGTAALQMCRTVERVVTFGTASAAKHDALRASGCTYPIDYRTVDYVAEIRRLTAGAGVDIALDPLGGENFRKDYGLLKPAGRLVCFGFANLVRGSKRNLLHVLVQVRAVPKFDPLKMMPKNRSVAGVNILHLFGVDDLLAREGREVMRFVEQGVVKPVIDQAVRFADAQAAFRRLAEGKNVGKVVLVP